MLAALSAQVRQPISHITKLFLSDNRPSILEFKFKDCINVINNRDLWKSFLELPTLEKDFMRYCLRRSTIQYIGQRY
jgi:hypothetical protein